MTLLTAEPSAIHDHGVVRDDQAEPRANGHHAGRTKIGRVVTLDRFRSGKAYTVAQAARLADTSPATVRRWLKGYSAPRHHMEPVFGAKPEDINRLSFLELVELIVASRFRKKKDAPPRYSSRKGPRGTHVCTRAMEPAISIRELEVAARRRSLRRY